MELGQGASSGLKAHDTSIADTDTSQGVAREPDFIQTSSSSTSAAEGYTEATSSQAPVSSTATRWSTRRGGRSTKAQEREELKRQRKMRVDKFDDFVEWIDGDASLRYHPKDSDARKHLSGWAMRNTNNHNKKVLKKSCLGVYVCNRSCRGPNGDIITIRPATSDRARRKQADKKCPRPGCEGKLYHVACTGKNGYPVTHFWRVTDSVIIFQSKGRHDHPRPDVVKTPSVAKMALFEYHRTHKHERPKDICKRMGIHIHKSFSRVDRVARQLREVQTVLAKDDKNVDKKSERNQSSINHGYALRSPLSRMWASQHPKMATTDNHQTSRPGLSLPTAGIRHHPLTSSYNEQPQYEPWPSNYFPPQHGLQAADYQHSYAGYAAQLPSDYYHGSVYAGYQLTSTGTVMYDTAMDLDGCGAPVSSKAESIPEGSRMTELTVMKDSPKQTMASLNGTHRSDPVKSNPSTHHANECISNLDLTTPSYPVGQSTESALMSPSRHALKRSLPPALMHIDAKQSKTDLSNGLEPHTPIKLTDQTPPINIDMSSFADIFDISASMGDEGLAGRPKTPVFHAPSPPVYESPQKPTGAAMSSDTVNMSPSTGVEAAHSPQTNPSVSTASTPSPAHIQDISHNTESTLASPSGSKYRQVIHHSPNGPVLTQLSTHTHQSAANPAEDENGTYIDFLVSMYLKDSEKPISHLKNELHVYTERNSQKSLTFRTEPGLQFAPHLKSPTSSQFDFSWYDMDRRSQHYRGSQTTQTSLLSPRNITGQLDYSSPFIKDVFCSEKSPDASRVLFMRNMNAPANSMSLNRHVF